MKKNCYAFALIFLTQTVSASGPDFVKVRVYEESHPDKNLPSSVVIGESFNEKLMTKKGYRHFVESCKRATAHPEVSYPDDCRKRYLVVDDETYTRVEKRVTKFEIQEDGTYVAPKSVFVLVPVSK
jgi:hypothetical protein